MKNDRLFQILYLLLEKHHVTAPELAAQLEVSVRTIYRDIDALSLAGVPVCTTPGKCGGISLIPGYTFDKALFSDEEQNEIMFSIQSLKAASQNVSPLLQKLGTVFQKEQTDWIEVDFSRWGFGQTDHIKFEQLKKAILQKHILDILYCGSNGTLTRRQIEPVKLIFKDKSWYLQAFCHRAEDFRLFKISRIIELTVTDNCFSHSLPAPPSPEEQAPPPCCVVRFLLRFSCSMAFRLYDEFDPSIIKPQKDGSFLVSVAYPMDAWVFSYLLSFGTDVEILEPLAFKEQLANYTKKIYQHHES